MNKNKMNEMRCQPEALEGVRKMNENILATDSTDSTDFFIYTNSHALSA